MIHSQHELPPFAVGGFTPLTCPVAFEQDEIFSINFYYFYLLLFSEPKTVTFLQLSNKTKIDYYYFSVPKKLLDSGVHTTS